METIYNVLNKNEQLLKIAKTDLYRRRVTIFNEFFREVYKRMNFGLLSEDKLVYAVTLSQVKLGETPLARDFLGVFKPNTVMETSFSPAFMNGRLAAQ